MNKGTETKKPFQKALIVSNFHKLFDALKTNNIKFDGKPLDTKIIDSLRRELNSKIKILSENDTLKHPLDIENGSDFVKSNYTKICAYDESIMKISSLKGIAYFTCHCIIRMLKNDFDPICSLNANYFTRAKEVAKKCDVFHLVNIKRSISNEVTESYESVYKLCYHADRSEIMLNNVPDHSILLIDGPLIGSQLSSRTKALAKQLFERDIITVFIVKNSDSMMLVNSLTDSGKYNSDLDWADVNLKQGYRSAYIKYRDQDGGHKEIFCYLKSFDNISPLRISFMEDILISKGKELMDNIMDMIYFLVVDQGTPNDPQPRLISIAEKYAKSIIKFADPYSKMLSVGLVPTINQSRWGRN